MAAFLSRRSERERSEVVAGSGFRESGSENWVPSWVPSWVCAPRPGGGAVAADRARGVRRRRNPLARRRSSHRSSSSSSSSSSQLRRQRAKARARASQARGAL